MIRYTGVLASVLLLIGCASGRPAEREQDFRKQITRLEDRLARNPGDTEALQELGEIAIRTRQFNRANTYLQQALNADAFDGRTLFLLGLAQESLGDRDTALRLYEKWSSAPPGSRYRQLLHGRYWHLTRELVREDLRRRLAGEDTLGADPRRIAVYPLRYLGREETYAPLGRGMADLITNDLATVPGLVVVERVRLQELLNELALGESGAVDAATAPRTGLLLGAGRVTGGNYDVRDNTLEADLSLAETGTPNPTEAANRSASLSAFVELQKELVFDLIEHMGIELTPEQKARIDFRPTDNLQAFLAYSRGLQEEDAGRYRQAARYYAEAARLDPAFEAASSRLEAVSGLVEVMGPAETVLSRLAVGPGSFSLLQNRIRALNAGISAGFVPGQESRRPAEGPRTLPDPPEPPTRR